MGSGVKTWKLEDIQRRGIKIIKRVKNYSYKKRLEKLGITTLPDQTGDISTLNRSSLKRVDKFSYLGSSVSSTETDIDMWLTKAWPAIDSLSVICKSDLTDKIKRSFFQAAAVSILLYGCTTWTLTKRMEKKFDGYYSRMLRAILNKSWTQHPTKQQLYGHRPPITKTIKIRQTRHAGTAGKVGKS